MSTNHFLDSSWGLDPPSGDSEENDKSVERRENLLSLAEKHKGDFDAETMMQVLDTHITDGGATKADGTIYQVVAVPEERRIWLQAPGYFTWQEIDLNRFF